MPGEGYNPYRDDDGKFASGPGGGSPGQTAVKGAPERRTAPTWPSHKEYNATSTNVKDHAARTRFHAHRAEFFAKKAAAATDPKEKAKFAKNAETSAKHAKTCAARAKRADPRSVGALRAKEHAAKAQVHATNARSSTPTRAAAPAPTPAHATAARVAQTSSAHEAAIKAVDETKRAPMATAAHKNFKDPRGLITPGKKSEIEEKLHTMSGKRITVEELTHGFAVPDGYESRLSSISHHGNEIGLGFSIHDSTGKQVATLSREIKKMGTGLNVYHAYLSVDKAHQGAGLSDTINGNALRHYEKWGVKKATVTAAAVGRYAWSRMGFAFDDPDAAVSAVSSFVEQHPHLHARRAEIMAEARVRAGRSGPHGIAAWELTGAHPSFTPTGPKAAPYIKRNSMRFEDTYNGPGKNRGGGLGPSDKKIEHGFGFGQAVLMSRHMWSWGGTLKIDRSNEGYLHAISKTKVAK